MIKRLCAAVLLTVGLVACSPPNLGRVVPQAAAPEGLSTPSPTPTTTPRPGPQPVEKHSGKGNASVPMAWPTRLGFVTFDCPKCSGHVAVNTENELIVNDIGPYKGTQWINDMPGRQAKTFTVKANAPWTLTITDESGLPVLEPGRPLSGKSEAVFAVPDGVTSVAVATKKSGRTAVWVHSGDYTGSVPVSGPAFVSVEGDGIWTVTAS
ncbi:hypothetical protein [Amycolatopsis sp. NPDC057786]|uniref:hypothetical protein n=1 Tax=Amycolatopsis sp. NPDC057786 TaxID=3346250 RepID=UPI0036716863